MTTTSTIAEQVADYHRASAGQLPAEVAEAFAAEQRALAAAGGPSGVVQPGTRLPDGELLGVAGQPATLAETLSGKPAVIVFYRGGWCPYCNLELKAYQSLLPRFAAAGASLVAISPEKPDDTVSTSEKNALTFPVLSDIGQSVGKAFGIVYAFTEELRSVYDGFNLDIPGKNGAPDDWSLPLSATYVIGADGVILFADTSVDYRHRTDPLDVLDVLERRVAAE